MGSKSLLAVLWLAGTIAAATVAWQSLGFVSASTEGEQASPTTRSVASSTTTSTPAPTSAAGVTRDDTPDSTNGASEPNGTAGTDTATTSSRDGTDRPDGAIEQTFNLIGGRTAIRFSPTEVVVVWATPNDGYTVESYPEDGGVEVEFSNGVHESKLEAWWADGPRFESREGDD